MSLIPTVLAVCLLVFATCEANLLPHNNIHSGGPPQPVRRAPTSLFPPSCGTCNLANVDLSGLTGALVKLGPALQRTTTLLGDFLKNLLNKLQDLKQAIYDVIKGIKDDIGPVLDGLSAAAAKIVTCPALKVLFDNLKTHLFAILDILQNKWFPIISQVTLQGTLDALSKTLIQALPDIVELIRDLLFNLLQIVGLGLCQLLGGLIWTLLLPNAPGVVYGLLLSVLQLLGANGALGFLTSLLGGLGGVLGIIPSVSTGKPADLLQTLLTLICNLLQLLGIQVILGTSCINAFGG